MRRAARPAVAALAAAALALGTSCQVDDGLGPGVSRDWTPGTSAHAVTVGALRRTFRVHVPAHRPTTATGTVRPYPLVIVLHGSNGSGQAIEHASQMDSLSEARGYLVAYPDAVRAGGGLYPADWNAGTCCGQAQREGIDDLGFLSTLVATVSRQLPVNAHRVYVAGFSSGALMAYSAGCHLAATLAAVASVEGGLYDAHCAPARAVPLVAINGTSDDEVPYTTPSLTAPSHPVPPAAATLPPSVQFWVAANGCGAASVAQPSAHVTETSFTKCSGADVMLFTIAGGTHGWPSEPDGTGSEPPMTELHASAAIADFFDAHRRP